MDTASRQVSVIVPVYNTEKYLRRCLESLVHQTLKDLEILVVDDGSTDHSPEILSEFENNYREESELSARRTEDRQVHGIWEFGSAVGIM